MARESPGPRAVIFIDEIDSLCKSRSEGDCESSGRIKAQLLIEMDGVSHQKGDVLVLGATNIPWELDSAFLRRFEKRIYTPPLPDIEARSSMLKMYLRDTPNNLSDDDFNFLGRATEGASGSHIKKLVKDAAHEPLQSCEDAQQFLPSGDFLMPCEDYPNCVHCPESGDCEKCGAKRMQRTSPEKC